MEDWWRMISSMAPDFHRDRSVHEREGCLGFEELDRAEVTVLSGEYAVH